ncbi:MAG: phospho-N-acetylmuramoyl-pentapeptide-transferase [Clostridia bacterium]|nr:phospho-N-acetylmuramoyl-pentapeptide-transferase [Clostridia bacterium]
MTEVIQPFLAAFALALLFCGLLIPLLKKRRAGQEILSYVTEHKNKRGTPTMGGLAFLPAAAISSVLFAEHDYLLWVALSVGMGYLLVGFLDDFIKIRTRQNLGLKAVQKIVFQISIALIVSAFCYKIGLTHLYIPFWKKTVDLGAWSIPYHLFLFLAAVNCVNLTDGLDSLAGGVSLSYFFIFGLMTPSLGTLCFALSGAISAFLAFNSPKASVFMGDTGSLSLGGFVAIIAVLSERTLLLPVVGLPFVISGLSVILQVSYFKLSGGKRIFLMAPFHHHLQKKGFSESKISYCYFLISLIGGLVCLAWG